MKIAKQIFIAYLVMWILTGFHARYVWNAGSPCFGVGENGIESLPRGACTVFFDFGINGAVWPLYWYSMFELGSWAWLPSVTSKVRTSTND